MQRVIITFLIALCVSSAHAETRELVIFHTNDIHGHFTAQRAAWRKDSALVGGFAALSFHLDKLRGRHANSLYLDAGDLMTGNPVCNIPYNGYTGGALQAMLQRCGVNAQCLGNHEFDLGADHLRQYVAGAPYPMLVANLVEKSSQKSLTAKMHVFEQNGMRIGVIGLLLDGLAGVASKTAIAPFQVQDAATVAQQMIDELDPVTDLIILLTHMGVDEDSVLATKIQRADAIVGGHSHTLLKKPLRVNNIIIVQAGSYLRNVGMLTLNIASDSVASYSDSLVELVRPAEKINTEAAKLADSLETVVQATYGKVIGEIGERWVRGYYDGSNEGNWICDRLRDRCKADVAFVNAGGIRADHESGPITLLQVLEMLPFTNSVVTFEVTGNDLLKTAREQVRAQGLHKHGTLEMSGMTVDYSKTGDTADIVSVKIGGKPVDPNAKYRVASIDYVAQSQWEEYLGFKPADVQSTGELISDAISDEIQKTAGPIHADPAPRLREVK
jgi:2',3'-cyclic-nucleotide 2'-phosphodiesterase (5'-nucleotidase family)